MTMPFLSIDWTLVVQLINTGILFLLLSKFLFKPVKAMIDSREAEVSKMYEDASAAKEQADRLQAEYAASISGAKEEANQIVKDAQKRAQMRSDEILTDAQTKASAMMTKAEEEIAREKKKAVNEIKDEISDLAVMIATKVVGKDLNTQDHEQMMTKAEEEIAREKKKAVNEIKDEISDLAVMIATKVVGKDLNTQDHEQLIQEFIDGAGDLSWKE